MDKVDLQRVYGPIGNDPKQGGKCLAWKKALLCIDLQYLGCAEGFGVFENHRRSGVSEESIQYFLKRLKETVIPNVRKLQDVFRKHGEEIIHIHIQSLTQDGRDRSLEHKSLGLHAPPGSKLARFLPEVAPQGDEIVLQKTASGVFISTNLEYVLRNLCVSELYVAGVYTNECISSAVRSGGDLGFQVFLASDATAAISKELHDATLLTVHGRYAQVCECDEIINRLEREAQAAASR